MNRYPRADVLRILHITAKQLVGWQRAGLLPISETFTFYDLLQLKKIRDLRAKRVRPAVIRESLQAMQKQVAGMENPLIEASVFSVGSRVAYRHEGHSVEPIAGQFVMDFGSTGTVASTGKMTANMTGKIKPIADFDTAAELFSRGIAMEEHPTTHDEAIKMIQRTQAQPGCRQASCRPKQIRRFPRSATGALDEDDAFRFGQPMLEHAATNGRLPCRHRGPPTGRDGPRVDAGQHVSQARC